MRNRYIILLLSVMLSSPMLLTPVMAMQEGSITESQSADNHNSSDDNAADNTVEKAIIDAEERKRIDEEASKNVDSFEPEALPENGQADNAMEGRSVDSETDGKDVSQGTGITWIASESVNNMDMSDYVLLAKKMDQVKEGDSISADVTYSESGILFDIDALSGMTEYRGPFSINVVNDSGKKLYSISFPDDAWKEENVMDLAATIKEEGKNFVISFHSKQELPFIMSVTFQTEKKDSRYLLMDKNKSQYGLQKSDESGNITFQTAVLKEYILKDASSHKYDAMDASSSQMGTVSAFILRNRSVLVAIVISAIIIAAACMVPVKKK